MVRLGVNIDHVATLRQARGTHYPDPLYAALIAEQSGADGITLHLREDRRHIQTQDVEAILSHIQVPMNLEMAATPAMIDYAVALAPQHCCLVPEKREEVTTEGGLDVVGQQRQLTAAVAALKQAGITVSLFIDPVAAQIDAATAVGAPVIELHTGEYAAAKAPAMIEQQYQLLVAAAQYAHAQGLVVNAGHGLHYHNVQQVASIPHMHELNIGHSIIARALFCGMDQAVASMKALISSI